MLRPAAVSSSRPQIRGARHTGRARDIRLAGTTTLSASAFDSHSMRRRASRAFAERCGADRAELRRCLRGESRARSDPAVLEADVHLIQRQVNGGVHWAASEEGDQVRFVVRESQSAEVPIPVSV